MEAFDFQQLHLRPRFQFKLNFPPELIESHLRQELKQSQLKLPHNINNRYINIDVPPQLAHFWSPRMSFEIESIEGNADASLIRGLIGPKPQVWTLFIFVYFALGISGLFASLYGLSKYSLDSYSHLVWAFPAALVLMSSAYLVSKSGEKIGSEQIHLLRGFLEKSIKNLKN